MSAPARAAIGLIALEQGSLERKGTLRAASLEKLRKEILGGECTLVLNGIGELKRVVSVVAIRLEDDDGLVFVDLGRLDGCVFLPLGKLPATKKEETELEEETVQRLLRCKFGRMAPFVDV